MSKSYEVANWLNEEASDKEFLEVFWYLYKMSSGRRIEEKYCSREELVEWFKTNDALNHVKSAVENACSNLENEMTSPS